MPNKINNMYAKPRAAASRKSEFSAPVRQMAALTGKHAGRKAARSQAKVTSETNL